MYILYTLTHERPPLFPSPPATCQLANLDIATRSTTSTTQRRRPYRAPPQATTAATLLALSVCSHIHSPLCKWDRITQNTVSIIAPNEKCIDNTRFLANELLNKHIILFNNLKCRMNIEWISMNISACLGRLTLPRYQRSNCCCPGPDDL